MPESFSVTAIDTAAGVQSTLRTDGAGFYNFPSLAVGTYDVEIVQKGFKTYQQSGIVLDANAAIRVDVKLELGQVAEKVVVASEAVHVGNPEHPDGRGDQRRENDRGPLERP